MIGSLILIKQMLIVVNYLFSMFNYYSYVAPGYADSLKGGWILVGIPAMLFLYYTIVVSMVQGICTKLIGELPGEALRHLHNAMTGHKTNEQMSQKAEQATDKMGDKAGDYGGKKSQQGHDKDQLKKEKEKEKKPEAPAGADAGAG